MSDETHTNLISLADSLQPLKDYVNALNVLHVLALVSPT
jgi:hypothetical protein